MVVVEAAPAKLEGGYTYEVQTCNEATGSKTMQLSGQNTECLSWIEGSVEWNSGAWWGACNGQVSIEFPFTITVPSNASIEITSCW